MCGPIRIALLVCSAVVTVVPSCFAQSLWRQRDPSHVFLFRDTKARQIGDQLTVVIRENTDVENKDQRALAKAAGGGGLFDFSGSAAGGATSAAADAALDLSASHKHHFDGRSQFTVERDFTDRITVSVIDVLPNGNLVIGGKRSRVIAGETRMLAISGIVRPNDINPDNTVDSPYVGNFQIHYEGDGQESSYTNTNWWLKKLMKWW